LIPATTEDQFDDELFADQCLTYALQKWHLYQSSSFTNDHALRPNTDIKPSSPNQWAHHIDLLLPACNSSTDTALGCLLGAAPNVFGGSRCAMIDVLSSLFHHIRPFLSGDALTHNLPNWHTFQEYFGLRVSTIKHSSKTTKLFFVCCFCDEAWEALCLAASAAGPLCVHGVWSKLSPFPPEDAKPTIIKLQDEKMTQYSDLHHVHTDRLIIRTNDDEQRLLLLTPNLQAIIPRFVDHSPDPACHTLLFHPDPTSLLITTQAIHKALIPSDLLAPPPQSPYLRAGTAWAARTLPKPKTKFSDTGLDLIFGYWSHLAAATPTTQQDHSSTATTALPDLLASPPSATTKRPRLASASPEPNYYDTLLAQFDDGDDDSLNSQSGSSAGSSSPATTKPPADDTSTQPSTQASTTRAPFTPTPAPSSTTTTCPSTPPPTSSSTTRLPSAKRPCSPARSCTSTSNKP
jgi:hypothetical protein